MSKILDEIHKIREKIYEEQKNLNTEEVLRKIRMESEEFMRKYNLELKRWEREILRIES